MKKYNSVVGAPRTTAFGGGARDGYAFEAPRPALCAGPLWSRGTRGPMRSMGGGPLYFFSSHLEA